MIKKDRLGPTFLKCGLGLFFAIQVVLGMPNLQAEVQPFLTVPNITYAEKMHIQWGAVFDVMDFVRRETPRNAVILMKDDGRPEFDQFFLFPRRVIYGDEEKLLLNPQINYVVIGDGYPQFPVDGIRIMLDDTHGLYELQR